MPKAKRGRLANQLRRMTDDASLNQAFQLAHSIFRYKTNDRPIALKVVSEALRAVRVRLLAQDEADRHNPAKPSKVRWNTSQWLQLLIYLKSEHYEKQQEANPRSSLSETDMIVRYLKHLILMTSRRNSFHLSLALSRLAYDYTAAETMVIYDLVFQDPDSSTRKADAYYRSRKNKLIEELIKRFHGFLRIVQGPRSEKRFETQKDSSKFAQLVQNYLNIFTPWQTKCELPKTFDAWMAIRSLQSSQASQIHALIHPSCFARITEVLKLDLPANKLALPRFFLSKDHSENDDVPRFGDPTSDLTPDEINEIRNNLSEDEKRRKKFTPHTLLVVADGVERARADLLETNSISIIADDDLTSIEVFGVTNRERVLLATHMITQDESDQPPQYSVVLEAGQKISLLASGASIEIRYEETAVVRAVLLRLRQLRRRAFGNTIREELRVAPTVTPVPVLLTLVLLIVLVGLAYFVFRSRTGEQIAQQQPTPSISGTRTILTTQPTLEASAHVSPTIKHAPPLVSTPSNQGVTREPTIKGITSLSSSERVYVESLGEDAFSRLVQQKLIEKLRVAGLVMVRSPNEADTAVAGTVKRTAGVNEGEATLQFLNVAGEVLWRVPKLRGTPDQISSQLMERLLKQMKVGKRD